MSDIANIANRDADEFTWAIRFLGIDLVDVLSGKIDNDAVDAIVNERISDLADARQILYDIFRKTKRQKCDTPLLEGTPDSALVVASTSIPSVTVPRLPLVTTFFGTDTLLILKAANKHYSDHWVDGLPSNSDACKRMLSFDGPRSNRNKTRSVIAPGAWILDKGYVLVGKVLSVTRPDENRNTYHLEVHMAKKMAREHTIPPMLFHDTTEHKFYKFANAICHWFGVPKEAMVNQHLMSGLIAIKNVTVTLNEHVELLKESLPAISQAGPSDQGA